MQITIQIPFRPLSGGMCTCPNGEIHQLPDGRWEAVEECRFNRTLGSPGRISLKQAIEILNKNSFYKHKIMVLIDSDVYPNENFLKEYDNVTILKSSYVCNEMVPHRYMFREAATMRDGFMSLPDEEWFCYSYIDDIVCAKNWDQPIVEAIKTYGDNHVYVPMFVEPKGRASHGWDLRNITPTPELIWKNLRETICCHSLTMPVPERGFIEEKEFDNFIAVANQGNKGLVVEPCGRRDYGYYAVMIMKAKHAKAVGINIGPNFDLDFDNRLYSQGHLNKVVVTNSFVLHPTNNLFKNDE